MLEPEDRAADSRVGRDELGFQAHRLDTRNQPSCRPTVPARRDAGRAGEASSTTARRRSAYGRRGPARRRGRGQCGRHAAAARRARDRRGAADAAAGGRIAPPSSARRGGSDDSLRDGARHQLQIDFGERRVLVGGREMRVYFFVAVLGYSRRIYVPGNAPSGASSNQVQPADHSVALFTILCIDAGSIRSQQRRASRCRSRPAVMFYPSALRPASSPSGSWTAVRYPKAGSARARSWTARRALADVRTHTQKINNWQRLPTSLSVARARGNHA